MRMKVELVLMVKNPRTTLHYWVSYDLMKLLNTNNNKLGA